MKTTKKKTRKGRGPWTEAQKEAARARRAAKKAHQGRDALQATASGPAVSEVEYESESEFESEFDVMAKINTLLQGLDFGARMRVSQFFASKYR